MIDSKAGGFLLAFAVATAALCAQVLEPLDVQHAAVGYDPAINPDVIATLNSRLQSGEQTLAFDERSGYLRALLAALEIPVESQMVVFSKTSLQQIRITPKNPRAIYFNDRAAVAWVPSGFIEIAVHDARQGAVFYTLAQASTPRPQLTREMRCLTCHYSTAAEGVAGFLLRSIPTGANGSTLPWLGNFTTDHRSPPEERWGGWYVTGTRVPAAHLGNLLITDPRAQELPPLNSNTWTTLEGPLEASRYPSAHSDIVALLVFDHQARMMNLLTRIGWQARMLAHEGRLTPDGAALGDTATAVVDYMLFVDEAPLAGVTGSSGFAEKFAAAGPHDRQGRSLRDLDLQRRLMRYPCSYMIYSKVFDGLPSEAREAIYRRLWEVLRGRDNSPKYAALSAPDRRAVLEILRDTKSGLPAYFGN